MSTEHDERLEAVLQHHADQFAAALPAPLPADRSVKTIDALLPVPADQVPRLNAAALAAAYASQDGWLPLGERYAIADAVLKVADAHPRPQPAHTLLLSVDTAQPSEVATACRCGRLFGPDEAMPEAWDTHLEAVPAATSPVPDVVQLLAHLTSAVTGLRRYLALDPNWERSGVDDALAAAEDFIYPNLADAPSPTCGHLYEPDGTPHPLVHTGCVGNDECAKGTGA